jgi:hypothetical protein
MPQQFVLPLEVGVSEHLLNARAVPEEIPIEAQEEVRLLAAAVEAGLCDGDGLGCSVYRMGMVRHGDFALQES